MRRTAHHVSESVHEGVFVLYPKMVRGFLNLMAWLPEPGNQNRTTKRPRRQDSVVRVTAMSSISLAQAGAEALTLNSIHTVRCNEAGIVLCCAHRPHRSGCYIVQDTVASTHIKANTKRTLHINVCLESGVVCILFGAFFRAFQKIVCFQIFRWSFFLSQRA